MNTVMVGNVHLIAGGADALPPLLHMLEKSGMKTQGNPDVYVRTYAQFGIGEARELRERASLGAFSGGQRAFIIVAPTLTNDAQNALLKTLEEPPADALFFFIVASPHTLLPTLRSRAQLLTLDDPRRDADGVIDVKKFLAAAPAKRLELLKPLLEKGQDDKRDLAAILAFLASLERVLEKDPAGLRAVYRARKYIGDRGALVKPLLEQVALLLPTS